MGPQTMADALRKNFLGSSPAWYKLTIIGFLILNPILYIATTPFFAGWCLVIEFIFTLAMALKCYPLQPGGLLAAEAIIIGMASPEMVYHEAEVNFPFEQSKTIHDRHVDIGNDEIEGLLGQHRQRLLAIGSEQRFNGAELRRLRLGKGTLIEIG